MAYGSLSTHIVPRGRIPGCRRARGDRPCSNLMSVGALAIGALAVGRLAIKRVAIASGRIDRLSINELQVNRLRVRELITEQAAAQPAQTARQAEGYCSPP